MFTVAYCYWMTIWWSYSSKFILSLLFFPCVLYYSDVINQQFSDEMRPDKIANKYCYPPACDKWSGVGGHLELNFKVRKVVGSPEKVELTKLDR